KIRLVRIRLIKAVLPLFTFPLENIDVFIRSRPCDSRLVIPLSRLLPYALHWQYVPMPYIVRPYRRFPVIIPATYENWSQEGQGIIWNLSAAGWRLSG